MCRLITFALPRHWTTNRVKRLTTEHTEKGLSSSVCSVVSLEPSANHMPPHLCAGAALVGGWAAGAGALWPTRSR